MAVQSLTPLMAMAASLGGVAVLGAASGAPRLRDGLAVGVAALQLVCVLAMLPPVLAGQTLSVTLLEFVPAATIAFKVDALGLTFALTASALWLLTSIYSVGYLRALHSPAQTRFHVCFALTMTATLGVAFAANLLTLYLFYEAMTLATYFLVVHDGTEEAYASGRKYLSYHLGTSIAFLLPAIILTYHLAGSFDFNSGGVFGAEALEQSRGLLIAAYVLFLLGSAKVALMPLHGWLPSAMVAPVPVSALLHAVAVVNAGAFGVLRILLDVFGPEALQALSLQLPTVWLASFTILAASLYALKLDSLKALLAYSTIGQLAYIVLGGALLNGSGVSGAALHLVNHGVAKITLFLCAGAIYVAAHRKYLSEMHGIGRQMPWTMAAFTIAALSMIGFPATAGFISKWFLFLGSWQAAQTTAIVVLVLSTLLSGVYYLRAIGILGGIGRRASAHDAHVPLAGSVGEPSHWILLPLLITAALTVLLGLLPDLTVLELVRRIPLVDW